MSRAPVLAEDYSGEDRQFAEATAELNRRVDGGTSWSGLERNQVFLNLGNPRGENQIPDFANISALAGFDFPDDSRGLAALDWDHDGDLDIITTNRSAPRVRIFENRFRPVPRDFLSILLRGGTVNRDAIGSRVELRVIKGEDVIVLNRTVRCGQGFLSQSSRWLHFGIPYGYSILSAEVFWAGSTEPVEIDALWSDQFFVIKQGEEQAELPVSEGFLREPFAVTQTEIPKRPPEIASIDGEPQIAHLERPVPLPAIPYTDLDGVERAILPSQERPLIVNLWATWCVPCVAELKAFAEAAQSLRDSGFDVLALCVDARPDKPEEVASAKKILKDTGFPFEAGFAGDRALALIHSAHNSAFLRPSQLPVPTTLVLAPGARLASVARGAIAPLDLAPGLEALSESPESWSAFSRPGEGRWIYQADTVYYVTIAKDMLERGWIEEAADFLISQRPGLETEGKKYGEMLTLTGTQLLDRGQRPRGIELLRAAVDVAPEFAVARNNLAVALLQANQGDEASGHLRAAIEADPEFADPKVNLARYELAQGRSSEALTLVEGILDSSYHPGAIRIQAQVLAARGETLELHRVFLEMTENEPANPAVWLNLGKLQLSTGDRPGALDSFRQAGSLDPGSEEIQRLIQSLQP